MTYDMVLDALADARRRAIFEALREAPSTVGELAERQPVSRPAVSQHLKVLETAGLVAVTPAGTRRIYCVRREGLADLRRWVEGFWDDVLESFAADVERRQRRDDDG